MLVMIMSVTRMKILNMMRRKNLLNVVLLERINHMCWLRYQPFLVLPPLLPVSSLVVLHFMLY